MNIFKTRCQELYNPGYQEYLVEILNTDYYSLKKKFEFAWGVVGVSILRCFLFFCLKVYQIRNGELDQW